MYIPLNLKWPLVWIDRPKLMVIYITICKNKNLNITFKQNVSLVDTLHTLTNLLFGSNDPN